jgi:hypothetical protein
MARDRGAQLVLILFCLPVIVWWVWALIHPGWDWAMEAPIEVFAPIGALAGVGAAQHLASE